MHVQLAWRASIAEECRSRLPAVLPSPPLHPPTPPSPLAHPAEAYVDSDTYAFSRGPHMVVVLTSGPHSRAPAAPPAAYNLTHLAAGAGAELCDALTGVRLEWRGWGARGQPQFLWAASRAACGGHPEAWWALAGAVDSHSEGRAACSRMRPAGRVLRARGAGWHCPGGPLAQPRAHGPRFQAVAAPRRLPSGGRSAPRASCRHGGAGLLSCTGPGACCLAALLALDGVVCDLCV